MPPTEDDQEVRGRTEGSGDDSGSRGGDAGNDLELGLAN